MCVVWRALKNTVLQGRQDLRKNCQIISQMSLPSTAFFITGQNVPEARERNLSVIIRLMKAEVFFVLITVTSSNENNATSAISHQTPNNLHLPNSHIEEPVTSEAIQVLNKGSNNRCITLVCYAVTCLCILKNFPMKLKQKSCNAMSDNSITVTNNMKLMKNMIYRPL